jgi:exonuclease VII large subunit
MRFDDDKDNHLEAFGSRTAALRQRLELVKRSLEAGNPASFLGRGFAIVTNARSGTLVRRALDVKSGDPLTIRLSEGEIRAVSVPEAAC